MTSSTPQQSSDLRSTLSLDTVLELISDRRRRFALYALIDANDGLLEFETLIEEVATLEAALANRALTRDRFQDVAADLYHWHLPVLADVGVLDCDARNGLVRYEDQSLLAQWAICVRRYELP